MAKFYGQIGFTVTEETKPGIWETKETAKVYYGDVLRDQRRWSDGSNLNDDLVVSNEISILADPFALENVQAMRWVEFMNAKWEISSAEIVYPRIRINVGGIWHGSE